MVGLFSVDPKTVASLSPYEAAAFAARLIRADAAASGLPRGIINIPMNITAPDGGVDGTATGSPRESDNGLVKAGDTAYQFRTGRFAPGASIPGMLFTGGGEIKPRIKSCLDGGGTLVVLLFGWDGAAGTDRQAMPNRFKRALAAKSAAYADARVDVLGTNMIAAAVERFPTLALDLRDAGYRGALSHRVWAALSDMSPAFRRGRPEDRVIGDIQACLLRSGGGASPAPVHVAVSGEPGSGKTRIVLEATREEGLAPRVVYAESPDVATAVIDELDPQGGGPGAILVIDECGHMQQAHAWNRLKGNEAGIDLVTIYNEAGIETKDTPQIAVENMADEQIAEIISGYPKGNAGAGEIDKWVKYCRPSPRAAHIVGKNLADNPDDVLRPPDDVCVWERWVAGREESGGEEYKDRLTVLRWLALFTKFGFDPPHDGDAERIARMVQERHPDMQPARFREIVRSLRATKVLQGHSILYITPSILHDYMWLQWWEYYRPGDAPRGSPGGGDGGDDGDRSGGGRAGHEYLAPLYNRYCDKLSNMQGKKGVAKAVEGVFGPDGPFGERVGPAGMLGSMLFGAAAMASPAAALARMERSLAAADAAGGDAGGPACRGAAVQVLRRMLRNRATFAGAARLLLALAEAGGGGGEEDDRAADEAAHAFVGAFDPAPQAGYADTPLAERLGVLADAVRGGGGAAGGGKGGRAQRSSLLACGAALRMERFSLAVPNRHGFGRAAEHWRPGNRAEVCAYLRGVLDLLAWAADNCGDDGARREAARAVLDSLGQTALVPEIAKGALGLAERMRSAGLMRGEELEAAAEGLAAREAHRMDASALERVSAIAGGASRGSLRERLARRVGLEGRRLSGRIGAGEGDAAEIGRLAVELAQSPAALDAELHWLAGGSGRGGDKGGTAGAPAVDGRGAAILGSELAARDAGGRMLGSIEEATRSAADGGGGGGGEGYLLCGYLAGMRRIGPDRAEEALDRMAADGALRRLLPRASCMGGSVSDRSVRRLLQCARDGSLGREEAIAGLGYGRLLDAAAEGTFWDVVRALLEGAGERGGPRSGDGLAGPAALNMVYTRYVHGGSGGAEPRRSGPPPGAALDVLVHEAVIGGEAGEGARQIPVEKWARVALALAKGDGQAGAGELATAAVRLAAAAIGRIGRPGIFESDAAIADVLPALGELLRIRPREVWEIAMSCAGPPYDKRSSRVRTWLAGGAGWPGMPRAASASVGAIRHVPVPDLVEWAAEDAGPRPGRIADMLPARLDVAREFLSRFGGCEGVAEGLARAFDRSEAGAREGEGGAGGMLARMEGALRGESDPAVAAWLGGRIRDLRAVAGGGADGRGVRAAQGIALCK